MYTYILALSGMLLAPAVLFAQADRISGEVDVHHMSKVVGNVNPLVQHAIDEGRMDPGTNLNYVQLVLQPSPAQQRMLDGLLGEQQNPRSSSFRKWLTPEQFADQFGVSDSDIAKITAWMRSQGFDI
ncbi:MAG: hypothetical protein JOZ32_19750, partial [Bryobacterales bacterium]|nr:hypothetical protein [Bryobacterales bacterium]